MPKALIAKYFLKDEVDILSELDASVLGMSAEELIERYQQHDLEFGKFWRGDLVEKTKDMPQEDRAVFIDIAYDVYDSTRAILYKKPILVPQVKPESRFRRDLDFNNDDFAMLEGLLKEEYMPSPIRKWWKFWSEGEFYELKTVADCVDFVNKNRMGLDEKK